MEIRHLSFSYGKKDILFDVSLSFPKGKITTLLGANGCGKSTLFKLCTRNLRPKRGIIALEEGNVFHLNRKDFARKVAIVHQQNNVIGSLSVRELVSYGRTPYLGLMGRMTKEDDDAIDWAIDVCDLGNIKDDKVNALSGGQRQRVWIAMALAQKSEMIFLDEPTTYLDVRYQVELLQLIRSLNADYGLTIVMVLHDINQALHYSDLLIGLKGGRVLFSGSPNSVVTKESMSKLYGIDLNVAHLEGKVHVFM